MGSGQSTDDGTEAALEEIVKCYMGKECDKEKVRKWASNTTDNYSCDVDIGILKKMIDLNSKERLIKKLAENRELIKNNNQGQDLPFAKEVTGPIKQDLPIAQAAQAFGSSKGPKKTKKAKKAKKAKSKTKKRRTSKKKSSLFNY
jgi:hypothetical protein